MSWVRRCVFWISKSPLYYNLYPFSSLITWSAISIYLLGFNLSCHLVLFLSLASSCHPIPSANFHYCSFTIWDTRFAFYLLSVNVSSSYVVTDITKVLSFFSINQVLQMLFQFFTYTGCVIIFPCRILSSRNTFSFSTGKVLWSTVTWMSLRLMICNFFLISSSICRNLSA